MLFGILPKNHFVRAEVAADIDDSIKQQEARQSVRQAKHRATKIGPKAVEGGIFNRLFTLREMPTGSS